MEQIEKLANKIFREEKEKHATSYQILTAIAQRLFNEYGVREVETDRRFIYVSNVKVFDIKAV